MNKINSVLEGIFKECHEDFVGLWVIVWELKHAGIEEAKIFETTLVIIRKLLADGKIIAGTFNTNIDDDFHEWQLPVEEIIAKIKRDWVELGHEPTGGDVVWFTAKEEKAG